MRNVASFRAGYYLIALIVVVLDRLTKIAVVRYITLNEGFLSVIPGVFSITHVENRGAAFGIFNDSPTHAKYLLLVGFSSLAVIAVVALLWKLGTELTATGFGLALILGGALGNQWDRLVQRKVTDFLHLYYGQYSWPDFNIADSAIVVGAAMLIFEIVFPRRTAEKQQAS